MAGVLVGFLFPAPRNGNVERPYWPAFLLIPLFLVLAVKTWSLATIDHAIASSRSTPSITPLTSDARLAEQEALVALQRSDLEKVKASALQAIDRAPMRPLAPTLLAISLSPNDPTLVPLMSWAGAAGWREPLTQLWLLGHGLQTGDLQLAATRADATLRLKVEEQAVLEAIRPLAATAEGRKELASRLVADPSWRRAFLAMNWAPGEEVALLQELARRRVLKSDEAARAVRRLADEKRWKEAWRVAGTLSAGRKVDGFEAVDFTHEEKQPFDWRRLLLPGTTIEILPDGKAQVSAEAGIAGPVLERALVLAPGAYRIDKGVPGQGAGLRWSAQCLDGTGSELVENNGALLLLPAACPGVRLQLRWTGEQMRRSDQSVAPPTLRRVKR
jgi:hypothetical protein